MPLPLLDTALLSSYLYEWHLARHGILRELINTGSIPVIDRVLWLSPSNLLAWKFNVVIRPTIRVCDFVTYVLRYFFSRNETAQNSSPISSLSNSSDFAPTLHHDTCKLIIKILLHNEKFMYA